MYHDVVRGERYDESGFTGAGPARYKLPWPRFVEHLDEIADAVSRGPEIADDLLEGRTRPRSWSLTFDDGGSSALEIGEELKRREWRGHFFVTTDRIGTRGFLDAEEVRALSRMGQIVGSHSCSHPARMSSCSPSQLLDEWRRSTEFLSGLLGDEVRIASVPGGYHSTAVAQAAAAAGIAALYTSEPVRAVGSIDGCLVIGRYAVTRSMGSRAAARLATGDRLAAFGPRSAWTARKAAKTLGGSSYLKVRAAVLRRLDNRR